MWVFFLLPIQILKVRRNFPKSWKVGYWFKTFRKKNECYWSLLQNGLPSPRGFQLLPQEEVSFPGLGSGWGQNKSPWPGVQQPAVHHLQGHSTIFISQCFTASHRGMCCCVKICSLTHCQSVTEIPSWLEQARRQDQGKKKTHKFQYLTNFYAHFNFNYLDYYSCLAKMHLLIDTNCFCQ